MDASVSRVLDPSAIMNALAVGLGLLAQLTALMPKDLDDRLTMLLNTCFSARVVLLREFLAAYQVRRAGEVQGDAGAQTHEYVKTYMADADRHHDNRLLILRLLRTEQATGPLVVIGFVLALLGIVAGALWERGQPLMVVLGATGLTAEVVALLTAQYVQHRYKGLLQAAEFQGR